MNYLTPESKMYAIPASNLHNRICKTAGCSNLVMPNIPGECITCSEVTQRDVVYNLGKRGKGCYLANIEGSGVLRPDGSFQKQT